MKTTTQNDKSLLESIKEIRAELAGLVPQPKKRPTRTPPPASFLTTRALELELASSALLATMLRHRAEIMRALGAKGKARILEAAADVLDDGVSGAQGVIERYGPTIAATLGDTRRLQRAIAKSERAETQDPPRKKGESA